MVSSIGLIGLGVMGTNLARNIASKKIKVSVFNRTTSVTEKILAEYGNEYFVGAKTLTEFVTSLSKPRKIIIMVQAGEAVDAVIDQLTTLLEKDDIIIDCGNSNYRDTQRRFQTLMTQKLNFIGCGVSGGEEGALKGPSIMPGGEKKAWQKIRPIFETIAARDFSGGPCVTYVGNNGAGHYVKMVHNGIEYGVMQLMAEAYDLLRKVYGLKAPEIAKIFSEFQKGKLQSYLFEISIPVLIKSDDLAKGYLVDSILDKAGQKGTGGWTVIDAVEHGVAIPTVAEAVFARALSSQKDLRITLNKKYTQSKGKKISLKKCIPLLKDALYAGLISTYAQGFALIQKAAEEEKWDIHLSDIARIWEGGCIIRAKLLNVLHEAYQETQTKNVHLFELRSIVRDLKQHVPGLRDIVCLATQHSVPAAAMATSLSYIDGITSSQLPANFIQGLRDFFGAHTYERSDREGTYHTEWK